MIFRTAFQNKREDISKEAGDYFNDHNREVGSLTKAISDGKATHLQQSKKVSGCGWLYRF